MSSSAPLQPEPQPITACTISRDVQLFDLLIEDMEAAMGENWGDLGFADALAFLEQPEADDLEFVAVALSKEDEPQLPLIADIIAHAKRRDIKVVLIADEVSPAALHQLLREGGDEFVPYPLPEGELAQAIARLRAGGGPILPEAEAEPAAPRAANDRSGVVIPVQGLAGGSGATTLAVNLAWELANIDRKAPPRVCLIDLDLQFGSTATYLDLPRREAVLEILSDTASADSESLLAAMMLHKERLHVLTSPAELVPLDLVGPDDVARLIEMARVNFDYVVIDMPSNMVDWSETVLQAAHVYLATLELDMRSAQNTMRLKRALQSEELPFEKLRFVLNRAPGFTDLSGKSRARRLADSLGISIEIQLPDGGRAVTQSADHGTPLAEGAAKSPLRREIAKLARSVHKVNTADAKAKA
ncbi:AAA family ATPase [Limimaricola hongkongensis]|uniref:Type II/IV secretion system ATPase TadZ/CpaE, associated with Flp pilus assembly n=1 Tax=Limimaricola hongkongensis DSM 17492 TaxID=1122180 RepID=A0A017H9H8_9RHOB|nr:AAA family ATPase [Limimaricola hongkongensis]EYD71142.1 Type II/IV secretion system ATPase TadZ/CpaE, associated with Flp pilus assembly [Limimaricola hongkongensis DSM 17492]